MTVAVVTGASQGIGRAISLRLALDGMDVAINDIETQRKKLEEVRAEIEALGRRSIGVVADVASQTDVERLVDSVVEQLGEINVFVANAGVVSAKTFFDLALDDWERVQSVNVRGVFLCYQKAAKQMITQGKGGRLIAACSIAGYRGSADALAYSVSKWGVRGLTQCLAQELARHGITVNAYCPGPVATEMWEKLDHAWGVAKGHAKWEAFHQSVEQRSAMKKASTTDDIAGTVSFLAGPDSNMITGQSIIVDGGIVFS